MVYAYELYMTVNSRTTCGFQHGLVVFFYTSQFNKHSVKPYGVVELLQHGDSVNYGRSANCTPTLTYVLDKLCEDLMCVYSMTTATTDYLYQRCQVTQVLHKHCLHTLVTLSVCVGCITDNTI